MLSMALLTSCYTTKLIPVNFSEPIVKMYEVSGTKDELFINANRWMISAFKDARSIIQYSDKTEGTLIGKYLLYYKSVIKDYYSSTSELNIYAIIEVTVKDGKARISITPDSWNNKQYTDASGKEIDTYSQEKAIADINALCESFQKSLQTESIKF